MPLSDTTVRLTRPRERDFKLTDGEGLYLLVTPGGSKLWRMAYRFHGKQKTLAIGRYPEVKLSEAREKRLEARRDLARGVDPSAKKVRQKKLRPGAAAADPDCFEAVAREWLEVNKARWVPAHQARVLSRLVDDVFPEIGRMKIDEIEPADVLAMLRKVEGRGAIEMAKRIRQSVGAVFRYGIALGKCRRDPAADIRDALKAAPRTQHHATLKSTELVDFYGRLMAYDGGESTALGIELVMHTFVRTGEIIHARRSEFEALDKPDLAQWRIPAERMKMSREHLVPLSPRAVQIVKRLMELAGGSDYLLPGRFGGAVSTNTLLFAIYRMGLHTRTTIHGFRSLASTSLNEAGFNRDWIERQLAHVPGDSVRAAYNAAEWLADRRRMMAWWSDRLEAQREKALLLR